MKDSKLSLLLIVLSCVVLVLIGLICVIGYNYFYNNQSNNLQTTSSFGNPVTQEADSQKTAKKINTDNIENGISKTGNIDSLELELNRKLAEFYTLKDEITAIKKNNQLAGDSNINKQKIQQLENKIKELLDKKSDVENENKRLSAVVTQLSYNTVKQKASDKFTPVQNKTSTENIRPASNFTASALNLSAIGVTNDKDLETNKAEETEKLVGSFTVKSNSSQNSNSEILVVVKQPDGRVMQNSWEGGTFESPSGKKIYTCKIPFEYKKGEAKRLKFSIDTENFQKGDYTVLIYQNGNVIGRNSKKLY
jgi:predicted negative regulator of RcsB-dependent stress response